MRPVRYFGRLFAVAARSLRCRYESPHCSHGDPFIGSEALSSGRLSAYQLRSRFLAIYPDVYVPRGIEITAVSRAHAAWLWSRREGVVAGQSAAALHRAKWVDDRRAAELLWGNRRPPRGIRAWSDLVANDEVQLIKGIPVTTPARTALDIACRYPVDKAVAAIDALARATHLKMADVEQLIQRYKGRRGIRNARVAIDLVDAGAESPRETWLRLLLIRARVPTASDPNPGSTTSTASRSPSSTWDGRTSRSVPTTKATITEPPLAIQQGHSTRGRCRGTRVDRPPRHCHGLRGRHRPTSRRSTGSPNVNSLRDFG